jgi:lambda family phage portal protein
VRLSFRDRVRLAAGALSGRVTALTPGWNYRGGTKSGMLFDGSKFRGALSYPSAFDFDTELLRNRSRKAYWDTPQASAIIGRLAENVLGTGLSLECTPLWDLAGAQGKTDQQKHDMAREIELRFHLYLQSHELDATGRQNGYEIQSYEFINRMRDGETIAVLRYSDDSRRMSPLSIQFILPEQVCDPTDGAMVAAVKARGNRLVEGFEVDKVGREVAVFIQDAETRAFTRIPFYGSSRRFVLHPIVADTLGAIRGTPLLANVLHELQKITDGTVAELEAMVINAVIAVWVKPSPDAPASKAFRGVEKRTTAESTTPTPAIDEGPKTTTFDKPGLIVQSLKAGEEVQSFDTKRPSTNFATFVREITKTISASKSIPIEVLEESFNQNYSASRAALLLFWNAVERWREVEASQFLGPIYEAWFAEEVRLNNIKATNFNDSPIIRRAWLNCAWIGDRLPSLDPKKEAAADDLRIAQGSTTRERNALDYNGSDFMENVRRLKVENEALADANASMQPKTTPATVPADSEDDDIPNSQSSGGNE